MVQLSKQADYAVIIITQLATLKPDTMLSAREISEQVGISKPMVTKLLKFLTRAQILNSTQGPLGGYRLARQAKDIFISDVIQAIDGEFAVTECTLTTPGVCKSEVNCLVRPHWVHINKVVQNALGALSVEHLLRPIHTSEQDQELKWNNPVQTVHPLQTAPNIRLNSNSKGDQ